MVKTTNKGDDHLCKTLKTRPSENWQRIAASVEDVHEMLKGLFKDTLQQIFEAEIEEHLGYKNSVDGNNTEIAPTATTRKPSNQVRKTKLKYPGTEMANLNLNYRQI